MFGPTPADEIVRVVKSLENQLKLKPELATEVVGIAKGALVALFNEHRDMLNRNFFYEFGKTFQLDENRNEAYNKVPEKYRQDFQEGVDERKELIMHREKCDNCSLKVKTIHTPSGRIYMARRP